MLFVSMLSGMPKLVCIVCVLPMHNAVVTGGDVVWHGLQEDASIPETHRRSATAASQDQTTFFKTAFK